MTNLQIGTAIYIFLFLLPSGAASSRHIVAFAGGFGPKSVQPRRKGGRESPKRKGLSEFEVVLQPSKTVENKDNANVITDDTPPLDKWGLPVPTVDDVFPLMPPGTELISAPDNPDKVSLQIIYDSLKDHMNLDLQRFDGQGIEKDPSPGREAMKLRLLHASPPVLAVEHFLSDVECQEIKDVTSSTLNGKIDSRETVQVNSATLSSLATSVRTSTSWFCHYAQVPTLIAKARHVLGIPLQQMEEPQVVRYRPGEEFSWHYDEIPRTLLENGGQRVATLLVYLNNVERGGGTIFRDLKEEGGTRLKVTPRIGSALLFFPAFADGKPDDRTLHKGEVTRDTKWICQMWIHQNNYTPVTPPGNSHGAALGAIERVAKTLGYTGDSQL
jgi:prolyl 4-hydroxylase